MASLLRLGVLPGVVFAMMGFGFLTHAVGYAKRALSLVGLAHSHPPWRKDHQRAMEMEIARQSLDPAVVETGLAKGAKLEWDATIQELSK